MHEMRAPKAKRPRWAPRLPPIRLHYFRYINRLDNLVHDNHALSCARLAVAGFRPRKMPPAAPPTPQPHGAVRFHDAPPRVTPFACSVGNRTTTSRRRELSGYTTTAPRSPPWSARPGARRPGRRRCRCLPRRRFAQCFLLGFVRAPATRTGPRARPHSVAKPTSSTARLRAGRSARFGCQLNNANVGT